MNIAISFREEISRSADGVGMLANDYLVAIDGQGYRIEDLPEGNVRACFAAGLKQKQFAQLCNSISPQFIEFKNLYASDFAPIEKLDRLTGLSIRRAPRLTELFGLSKLPALDFCAIDTCLKITDLGSLSGTTVSQLHLSGGMSKPLWVETLVPLVRIRGLRVLSCANVKIRKDGLAPLAEIDTLESVHLPLFYPRAQYEMLHRRRPDLISNCNPFADNVSS